MPEQSPLAPASIYRRLELAERWKECNWILHLSGRVNDLFSCQESSVLAHWRLRGSMCDAQKAHQERKTPDLWTKLVDKGDSVLLKVSLEAVFKLKSQFKATAFLTSF